MKIFMGSFLFWEIFVFDLVLMVSGNAEVDALNALKTNLADPNNVFQTWNSSHPNPCSWFHVTCNKENSVTRVDMPSANLSGQLVPQLGRLTNLEYLELFDNHISGRIPDELGNLKNLVSLDLYLNGLTGPIPDSLGNLEKLQFLRLNNNSLSGNIPMTLTNVASLQVLDLSNNQLTGDIPVNGSFSLFHAVSFANNPGLTQQKVSSTSSGHSGTGAISGGVAAGVALLFAASAMLGN